jgi:hypothetical protein
MVNSRVSFPEFDTTHMTEDMIMAKIEYRALDSTGKRAVFLLADGAGTLTNLITDAASHIGEVYEAVAFMKAFPMGSEAYEVLAARLRLGGLHLSLCPAAKSEAQSNRGQPDQCGRTRLRDCDVVY